MRLKKILATVLTLTLMASAAVCIPFTASAEYSGTKYTFGSFDMGGNTDGTTWGNGLKGYTWTKETDSDTYLRYTDTKKTFHANPAIISLCPVGQPGYNDYNKVGFTPGKKYAITMEYRFVKGDWRGIQVDLTLLKDGLVTNYNSYYNQKLLSLADWQANNTWATLNTEVTLPSDFDGDAAKSNIGIVLRIRDGATSYTDADLLFDVKSVTVTPAIVYEQDDMTIDFSNHQTKASADDYGSNCVVQNTPFSNWTSVTEESGNRYLKLEKTGTAQDFKAGQWQYEADDGFNLICNQAGNVGWYGYEAPLKDAFVLKDNTEYFIKLRYRLKFTDGAGGTVPVKMLHTGKLNTASQALCECGIENNGVTLAEADGWKTVAFSATNKCIDSEDWNSFGLGFYDETVTDRNFELCVDEVTISSTNPMYGDADGNNEIDIRDLVRIKRYSAGMTDEINSVRSDLDFDGVVGSGDLALLRRQLIG